MKEKSIVIVAHKYVTQPDDDLVIYLNMENYANVMHIRHSFSDAPDRKSYYSWYKNGELHKEESSNDFKGLPEPLIYFKEMIFTLWWIVKTKIKWDWYIGMDGLLTTFGYLCKTLGMVNKVAYWVIDFVPEARFSSTFANIIYKQTNMFSYKNANEVWDLSPRMAEAREKFWGLKESDYKKRRVVPYGVWLDKIKRYSYEECEKHTLVFMGHLIKKQGVQLVIRAIPEVVKQIPDFKFKILGGGSYKPELEKLAKELGVLEHCDFRGRIESHEELEDEIAKSAVAIAPYIKELDTWTYYADPGKIKEYLACGVPVLLTDVPWNASEIHAKKCGVVISPNIESITSSVQVLFKPDVNKKYRENCVNYSEHFSYREILKGAF